MGPWLGVLGAWFALNGLAAALVVLVAGHDGQVFLWRHFAGPWLAEATQQATVTFDGVTVPTGYTLVSEVVYIATIVVGMVSAYQLVFEPREIPIDAHYVLALVPVTLGGALVRALEDASLFCRPGSGVGCQASPAAYLAISPLVYIALFVATVVVTARLAERREASARAQKRQVDAWLVGQGLVALAALVLLDAWFAVALEWAVLLVLAGAPAYRWLRGLGLDHVPAGLVGVTAPWVLVPAAYVGVWFLDPWQVAQPEPGFAVWVLSATILALGSIVVGVRVLGRRWRPLARLGEPLGASVVGAHLLDGIATFFAVCGQPGGLCSGARFVGSGVGTYREKHPVSEAVLSVMDGWAFPIAKGLLAGIFVIGLFWAAHDEETPERTVSIYLLIVLLAGFVPGARNLVRAAMGI